HVSGRRDQGRQDDRTLAFVGEAARSLATSPRSRTRRAAAIHRPRFSTQQPPMARAAANAPNQPHDGPAVSGCSTADGFALLATAAAAAGAATCSVVCGACDICLGRFAAGSTSRGGGAISTPGAPGCSPGRCGIGASSHFCTLPYPMGTPSSVTVWLAAGGTNDGAS